MLTPGRQTSPADFTPDMRLKAAEYQKAEADRLTQDWPWLCRFADKNAALVKSGNLPRVVFIGDSITENWLRADPVFFSGDVANRGIGGQTSGQILLRFYQDVVALHPSVVHIMAGTNDVAGNLGPETDETILDNIQAMIDIAQANHIRVILASIPPCKIFMLKPNLKPAHRIKELDEKLRQIAAARNIVYVDYYAELSDNEGGSLATLSNDGVHPNRDGYRLMRPLAEQAIAQAASSKP